MRNLKRALSLALASVMLLGMMVVGTSAASYPDVDENDNVEAIEVLNAVNVMIGRQGNFEPDEAVNRHEMAVIMAKLVLGVDTADNYVGSHPFTDVVPWADKYVAACYENGLIAGTSATTYGGGSPLTAVQAAAMMLRALGYKDLSKGAADWRAPVTAMANQIRLFSGVASNPNEKLNRNQVAQLALNTLKSPMVNLKDNTISWTDGEGQVIITGGSREYIALSSHEAYAQAINNTERAGTSASGIQGYTVELGEHLYNGKLKLNNKDIDVFGRPSRTWEYDGKKIGSYIKEELMVKNDVGKVTGNDLYTLLGSSTIKDYTLDVYVDGVNDAAEYDAITDAVKDNTANTGVVFNKTDLNRNNKATIGATGTGVLMQVFVDHEDKVIYVAVINTYLAIADKAYDEKKEEASIKVYDLTKDATKAVYAKTVKNPSSEKSQKFTLGNEDFALVKDIAKDDPYLVTVADGAIQTIEPAEVISDATISAFKRGDHVVTGGTKYNFTTTAGYNYEDLYTYTSEDQITQNLKDLTYNIYLDAYGNLIGLKAGEGPKNYVFITSIDRNGSYVSNKTATANAIFTDGTSATISINMDKSKWVETNRNASTDVNNFANTDGDSLLNTWCTYTKSGDVYTVKEVWDLYDETIDNYNDSVRLPQSGTSDTVNNTKLGQFRNMVSTGGQITLKDGLRLSPLGKTGRYANIYGDSSSVYMTADMGKVVNNGTNVYGVIKGVDSVFKGIDGTDITVWDLDMAQTQAKVTVGDPDDLVAPGDPTANGVYTLFNNDGIVIASVIVGEGSAAKDLVYVTSSDLSLEEDNGGNAKAAGDGKWTFYREVVRNGEKVTLTEVGETVEALSAANMKQYTWYQIKTNGDGNVTSATPAFEALGDYNTLAPANYGKDIFVVDYEDINDAVETSGIDTVLYHINGGSGNDNQEGVGSNPNYTNVGFSGSAKLSVKGNNVLAVDTLEGSGIYFRSNVNVVWTYYNRNTNSTEVIIDTGVDAVKAAVDFVNENTKKCVDDHGGRRITAPDGSHEDFFVSALIQNGAATTITIQDRYNDYSRPADNTQYDQKLYLTGVLGGTFYTNNTSVFTVDAEGKRTPVSVDKDWDTWNSTERRYTIKSGSDVLIIDSDIDRDTYAPYFSSKVPVTETLPKIDGVIRFTMPKADVTIYDDTPGGGPEGLELDVDVSDTPIGPNGAEVTYDVMDDGSLTNPGVTPRAVAAKIGTMTITLDKDAKVTNIVVEYLAENPETTVVKVDVTVDTGVVKEVAIPESGTATPAADVAIPDAVANYVAVATVDNTGKITGIVYNPDKLAEGESLPIVNSAGEELDGATVDKAAGGAVSVTPGNEEIGDGASISDGETDKGLGTNGTVGKTLAASINKTALTVTEGETGTATVTLNDNTATSITATSGNTAVATVTYEDGTVTVTGVAEGETTVTVNVTAANTSEYEDAALTIAVTVEAADVTPADLATLKVNGADAIVSGTTATATIATIEKGAQVTIVGTATNSGTVTVSPASPWTVPGDAANGTTQDFTVTVKNSDNTTAKEITLTVTLTAVTDPAPTITAPAVEKTNGADAIPGFTAGTPTAGTPAEGAATLDLSGTEAIADASAVTSESALDVGGVTVDLSSLDVDGKTPAEILAAIEAAVKTQVGTANTTAAAGTDTYNEVTVEDGAVTAKGTTGFQVAFSTTEQTYSATNTPATAAKATVDFAGLTGANLEGVTVTVSDKVFEFVLTGGSATGTNVAVTVASDATAAAVATAFATAVSGASATGVASAAAGSEATAAVVTITSTATGSAATLTVTATAPSSGSGT